MKTYILLSLIFFTFQREEIYMCHDEPFQDEQCLKKEKLGSNTFYWLRKCKKFKVCVDLPYYEGIIGSCVIKIRLQYDGEPCNNNNKCTSGVCFESKCFGIEKGLECEPGLGQCKKGLLCRLSSSTSSVYTCESPIEPGVSCGGLGGYSLSGDYLFDNSQFLDPG